MRQYVGFLDAELLDDDVSGIEDKDELQAHEEFIAWIQGERAEQLELIRRHLNRPIPQETLLSELGPAFTGYGSDKFFEPISRMTVVDLYKTMRELPKDVREKLFLFLESGTDLDLLAADSAEVASWMDLSLVELAGRSREYRAAYRHGFGTLIVDLSITDDLLEQSFKRFLKSARSKEQAWELGVDQDVKLRYQKWVDYGVLAYIDLTTWAADNDRTITSAYAVKAFEEFGVIRDPEYRFSAYTIDTTVKKYVNTVLSKQVASRLLEAASQEIERRVYSHIVKS